MSGKLDLNLKNHYETLGVNAGESLREIKRAARGLFMKYHPDLNPDDRVRCEEKIKGIIESYQIIVKALNKKLGAGETEPGVQDAGFTEIECAEEALVFELSHRLLGLSAVLLREIVRVEEVRLESAGMMYEKLPFVSGVFKRDGKIVVLWNLHKQFRLRETPISSSLAKSHVVIAEHEGSLVGFMVDGIMGMASVEPDAGIVSMNNVGIEDVFIDGMVRTGQGYAGLLNLNNVLYNNKLN